jgi:hypothetical protein
MNHPHGIQPTERFGVGADPDGDGFANEPPYGHHGQYTTLRQAVLAHAGEAAASCQAFQAFPTADQDAVIEFLKTLHVLPPGTKDLIVEGKGRKRKDLPPFPG